MPARLVRDGRALPSLPRVVRPVTFGFRRPVVLVAPGVRVVRAGAADGHRTHELLHVARRDWLRTLADEVLLTVLWFHPVLWWLVEQIRLSTEQLVDREVVRRRRCPQTVPRSPC